MRSTTSSRCHPLRICYQTPTLSKLSPVMFNLMLNSPCTLIKTHKVEGSNLPTFVLPSFTIYHTGWFIVGNEQSLVHDPPCRLFGFLLGGRCEEGGYRILCMLR